MTAAAPGGETPIYAAIAHPARRRLLDLLAERERTVKELAAPFAMSRPAVSQHLKVLLDAGLVAERRAGRERLYHLRGERLREVHTWLSRYERFWRDHLERLGRYLEEQA
jgi:DNA-binding transcriptional ArsR family regulator